MSSEQELGSSRPAPASALASVESSAANLFYFVTVLLALLVGLLYARKQNSLAPAMDAYIQGRLPTVSLFLTSSAENRLLRTVWLRPSAVAQAGLQKLLLPVPEKDRGERSPLDRPSEGTSSDWRERGNLPLPPKALPDDPTDPGTQQSSIAARCANFEIEEPQRRTHGEQLGAGVERASADEDLEVLDCVGSSEAKSPLLPAVGVPATSEKSQIEGDVPPALGESTSAGEGGSRRFSLQVHSAASSLPESDNETAISDEMHPSAPVSPRPQAFATPSSSSALAGDAEHASVTQAKRRRRRHRKPKAARTTSPTPHIDPDTQLPQGQASTASSRQAPSCRMALPATELPSRTPTTANAELPPQRTRQTPKRASTCRAIDVSNASGTARTTTWPSLYSGEPHPAPEQLDDAFRPPVIETSVSRVKGQWSPFASGLNIDLVSPTPPYRTAYSTLPSVQERESIMTQNRTALTGSLDHEEAAKEMLRPSLCQPPPGFEYVRTQGRPFCGSSSPSPSFDDRGTPFGCFFPAFRPSLYGTSACNPAATITALHSPVRSIAGSSPSSPMSSGEAVYYDHRVNSRTDNVLRQFYHPGNCTEHPVSNHQQYNRKEPRQTDVRDQMQVPQQFSLFDRRLSFSKPSHSAASRG